MTTARLLEIADASDDGALVLLLHRASAPRPVNLSQVSTVLGLRASLVEAGVGWVELERRLSPVLKPRSDISEGITGATNTLFALCRALELDSVVNPLRYAGLRLAWDPLYHTVEPLTPTQGGKRIDTVQLAPSFWALGPRGQAHPWQELRRQASRNVRAFGLPVTAESTSPSVTPSRVRQRDVPHAP